MKLSKTHGKESSDTRQRQNTQTHACLTSVFFPWQTRSLSSAEEKNIRERPSLLSAGEKKTSTNRDSNILK